MDPRHEPLKEAFLNHLITTINFYIQQHLNDLVNHPDVIHEIDCIAREIYRYLGIKVDVEAILSRHNLLSIDVVLFPSVADTEANKILTDEAFKKLVSEIKLILKQHRDFLTVNKDLENNVSHLFQEYEL